MMHLKKLILKYAFYSRHIYDAVENVWSLLGFFSVASFVCLLLVFWFLLGFFGECYILLVC